MLGCWAKIGVFLWLALFLRIQARMKVDNGAFQNVEVAFSSRLSPLNGKALVDSAKKILSEASEVLQTSINLRIGSVHFHLPQTWNASEFEISSLSQPSVSPNIRIESLNDSAFGKFPYASQYGGCGIPGKEIVIPNEFFETDESNHKGKLLAREWLKYQYGVFDENGFPNDVLYPLYFKIPGSEEIHITDCTSPHIEYTFRNSNNESCTLAKDSDCSIYPEDESAQNATSSLMFFHKDLLSLNHVCEEDTHNQDSLSKQNLLCNYKSIAEVIKNSGDLRTAKESDEAHYEIKFSYFQESKLRLVVAWEDMWKSNKKPLINKAIRKLMYDVPLESEIGLYTFINTTIMIRNFSELLPTDRNNLILDKTQPPYEPNPTSAVKTALQNLTSNDEKDPGTIIIITASNPGLINKQLIGDLKRSNVRLVVIGFNGAAEEDWNELVMTSSVHGSFWEIKDSEKESELFQNLYEAIGSVLPTPVGDFRKSTIYTNWISANEEIEVPVNPLAESFTWWIFGSIAKDLLKCSTAEGDIDLKEEVDTTELISFSFEPQLQPVKCKILHVEDSHLVQMQMTTKSGSYINHAAWIYDTTVESSKMQMPVIIYAQIYFGQYPIQNARVRAYVTNKAQSSADKKEGTWIELLDDGRGDPDITKNDGIYSRYFTEFETAGVYDVLIVANSTQEQAKIGKNGASPCCGSTVVSESVKLEPFTQSFSTSFKAISKKPEIGYKPSRVTDLKIDSLKLPGNVTLTWTAPGGEMDQGQAQSYIIKSFLSMEEALTKFSDSKTAKHIEAPSLKAFGETETLEISLDDFEDNVTYYFAVQANSDKNQTSSSSNIVSVFIPEGKIPIEDVTSDPPPSDSRMKPETIGLIVGLVLLLILLIVCVYLIIYRLFLRPKRKKENRESRSQHSSERFQHDPQIANSIPADVIMKHHNEVVSAKKFYKSPPIFKEEDIEMSKDPSNSSDNDSQNNNVNYTLPDRRDQRTFQDDQPKSPKRMTVV